MDCGTQVQGLAEEADREKDMKKYEVRITASYTGVFTVFANDEEEAAEKADEIKNQRILTFGDLDDFDHRVFLKEDI